MSFRPLHSPPMMVLSIRPNRQPETDHREDTMFDTGSASNSANLALLEKQTRSAIRQLSRRRLRASSSWLPQDVLGAFELPLVSRDLASSVPSVSLTASASRPGRLTDSSTA